MYQRILVPLDGSATGQRGLQEAITLAAEQHATLVLLHVVDDYPMLVEMSSVASSDQILGELRQHGEQLLASAQASVNQAGVTAQTLLREITQGRVAEAIVDEAVKTGCDLIVMGTHGRRGFSRLTLGSDAEFVVRNSQQPVLLVRWKE